MCRDLANLVETILLAPYAAVLPTVTLVLGQSAHIIT